MSPRSRSKNCPLLSLLNILRLSQASYSSLPYEFLLHTTKKPLPRTRIFFISPDTDTLPNRIVLAAGQLVLRQGGVIRDIANWGTFTLPKPVSRHEMRHTRGHYFVMRFDAGVRTQDEISRNLRLDPRMIRTSSVKLGDGRLETLSKFGKVPW